MSNRAKEICWAFITVSIIIGIVGGLVWGALAIIDHIVPRTKPSWGEMQCAKSNMKFYHVRDGNFCYKENGSVWMVPRDTQEDRQ